MRLKTLSKLNLWGPPIVWAGVIFLFSSLTVTPTLEVYWKDFVVKKSAHILEYGVFAVLLYRALRGSGVVRPKAMILSVLLAILYGITDEIHQSFTPGREPRLRDIVFDGLGAAFAVYLVDKKGIIKK